MGTTADKLNKLLNTKQAIKQSIISKGVEVNDDTVFADYPDKIAAIESGGGADPYYEQLYMLRTSNETNMKGLFYYCNSPELDLSRLDTSKATDMSYMFDHCTSQVNIDGWDTNKVTNTSYMFNYFAGSIDLTKLDFSNVTNVSYMFNYANIDKIILTGLNFSKTNSFNNLFASASGDLLDLSSWNISNITNMSSMFSSARIKKIDLTGWKTTNVTNMGSMFSMYGNDLTELIIPDWDMTNTTSYSSFFNSSSSYTKNLMLIDLSRSNDTTITKIASTLPTRTITTFGNVLIPVDSSQAAIEALAAKYWKPVGPRIDITSCEIITELDEIKPGKTTKLYISNCEPWYGDDRPETIEFISSNESVATIDGNVITSTGVEGTTEITVRNINTQEVISEPIVLSVSEIDNYPNVIKFRGTNAPTSSNFIYVNGTSSSNKVLLSKMNYNAASGIYTYDVGAPITSIRFNGYDGSTYANTCTELVKINTSNMTSMEKMFKYTNITELDASDFDTSNVTSMENIFQGCSNLTSLDLSSWDTSNVTNMISMFRECYSLTSLDLSSWNTSKAIDMGSVFYNCNSLTSLDLSNWDVSNVTNIGYMFYNCSSLLELDLSNFNTSSVSTITNMFTGCTSLHTLRLDNCNNTIINRIIKQLPTGTIEGITRRIYCKEENAAGLTPPKNWVFEYIE